jgi:hypothetical protein
MTRLSPWLTALLQTVILLAVVAYAEPWLDAAESPLPTPRRSGDITLRGHQPRPVYNGSVVAGGVYSTAELSAALNRDPIVAAHYRGVDPGAMRAVTLTAGRAAYVSYRVGSRIYWTRDRVWLKAGETVLTDGTTVIRARCGNCVSDVKQEQVAAVDPAHGELDDFVVPPTSPVFEDPTAAIAEAGVGDLLQVPFAPQTLALLTPGGALLMPTLRQDGLGGQPLPVVGMPPLMLPGGGGSPDPVPTPPGGVVIGNPLPVPPVVFVPPGGVIDNGPGPGTTTTTTTTTTTGGGGDTTGGDTTGGDTTGGDTTGGDTTGGGTTGTLTNGTTLPTTTTAGGGTSSTGTNTVPEPGMLWLVAAAVIGVASRRLRT